LTAWEFQIQQRSERSADRKPEWVECKAAIGRIEFPLADKIIFYSDS